MQLKGATFVVNQINIIKFVSLHAQNLVLQRIQFTKSRFIHLVSTALLTDKTNDNIVAYVSVSVCAK